MFSMFVQRSRVNHGFIGPPSNTRFDKTVKFDALASFNFIEHLPKPRETLLELNKLVSTVVWHFLKFPTLI